MLKKLIQRSVDDVLTSRSFLSHKFIWARHYHTIAQLIAGSDANKVDDMDTSFSNFIVHTRPGFLGHLRKGMHKPHF